MRALPWLKGGAADSCRRGGGLLRRRPPKPVARASIALASFVVASFTACGGGGGGTDGSAGAESPTRAAFQLQGSQPADGDTAAVGTNAVVLTFNADVAPARVNADSVRLSTRDGVVAATLEVAGPVVRIVPSRRLAPNEAHSVRVEASLADPNGNALRQVVLVRFTTAGPGWRPPADASGTACPRGVAQHALMDDGTLLLACTANLAVDALNNAPLWKRSAAGVWSVAAGPPTKTARAQRLLKLGGASAVVQWVDYDLRAGYRSVFQTWASASGMGVPFSVPPLLDQPDVEPLNDSFGSDGRVVRVRTMRQSEAPAGVRVSFESAFELVDASTGRIVATLPGPLGRKAIAVSTCRFPSGNRLLFYASWLPTPSTSGSTDRDIQVQTSLYSVNDGWQPPTLLDSGSVTDLSVRALCLAEGVARVFWFNQSGGVSRYSDFSGSGPWKPARDFSSTGQLVRATQLEVHAAMGNDGSAFVNWNDLLENDQGSLTSEGRRYAWLPHNFVLAAGASTLTVDTAMPNYVPGSGYDTSLIDVAFNPRTRRFVATISGGPVGAAKVMTADMSETEGWSNPWSLPPEFTGDWHMDFNSSGAGALVGTRNGQLLVSDWR